MKTQITRIGLVFGILFFARCEEKVEKPSADFHFEITDPNEGTVVMQEPYQVKVNEEFFIVSDNDADFNSFWPGDIVYSGSDTIIRVYTPTPTIKNQGINIGESGTAKYSYPTAGSYTFTFVSVNSNAGAEMMETATKTGTITVVE